MSNGNETKPEILTDEQLEQAIALRVGDAGGEKFAIAYAALQLAKSLSGSDPNELQNSEAQKLMVYQRERGLRQRIDNHAEGLKPLTEEDRRFVLNGALTRIGSALGVVAF